MSIPTRGGAIQPANLPGSGNRAYANSITSNRLIGNSLPGVAIHNHASIVVSASKSSGGGGGSNNPDVSRNAIVGNYIAGNGPDPDAPTTVPTGIAIHGDVAVVDTVITNNFIVAGGMVDYGHALDYFDVVTESSKAGFRKPDPRVYRRACDLLGIEPGDAVILDDLGINLKPARAMGMRTIKVVDPATALDDLESVVGFPLR